MEFLPRRRHRRDGCFMPDELGGVAATACGYGTTTPSPRRRAGIDATPSTRNEPRRRAGTWGAPFGYLALFWTLAAFSFFWRAAQSEAERPSGTYLCFERWCAGARSRPARRRRARAVTPNDSHLFWEYLVQLRAARPPAARASQPEMLFSPLYSDPAAPCGARRPRAARRGGAPAVKLLY